MLYAYSRVLTEIALYVMAKITTVAEANPVITSAYRVGDSGVHGHMRGIDFRTWYLDQTFIDELCDDVNNTWVYDPERPEKEVLIYHDVGRGPHLHLQVHPNTTLRKELS